MKVVLDTNELVSALLERESVPGQILQAVWDGTLDPVLSEPLLEELCEVLDYPKIRKWLGSGYKDLLVLADQFQILTPAAFVARFLS